MAKSSGEKWYICTAQFKASCPYVQCPSGSELPMASHRSILNRWKCYRKCYNSNSIKTCCTRPTANGRASTPCTHSFVDANTDTWSPTRRELCISADRPFIHATRILDVVLLKHPVPVCTMGGVFKHRIPISAIPLTTMSSQQRHVWEHTVSLNQWTKHHMRGSKMLIVRPHWYDLIKHTLNCDSVRIYLNRVWEAK